MSTTVCFCNEVTEEEVEEFLIQHPNATFQEIQRGTAASSSCGRCAWSVKKLVERIKEKLPSED